MKKITKAMIFAAGFGKRLVPLTEKIPKPLLQLNGKTLLENSILFLEDCGIKEIVINVHYLADQIIEFIEKNKFKSKIYISHEKEKILGTGGGLNYANQKFKNFFKDSFVTINPDTLWNIQYINAYKIMEEIRQVWEGIAPFRSQTFLPPQTLSFDKKHSASLDEYGANPYSERPGSIHSESEINSDGQDPLHPFE